MAILAECPRVPQETGRQESELCLWGGPGERKAAQESPLLG